MADLSRYPDAGSGSDYESPAGIPRWLKVVGIIALVVILLVVIVLLNGGGLGHTPPAGGH